MNKRIAIPALIIAMIMLAVQISAAENILDPKKLDIQEHELSNGLKILTWEDHSAPVITYQVWFNVGSINERPGITGISHLFEHLMFKGSKKYGPEEHNNIIQAHGGRCNAFTSNDMTVYHENIASDELELVIAMEAERQANLAITAENLKSEREVVKEERRMRVDNSVFGDILEQLSANAYEAHPYMWSVVGWMSDLNSITLDECQEYHRIHYAPNNATVVIVGDFKTAEAVKLVEKYYGAIPRQESPATVATVEPKQRGERRVYLHRRAQLPMLLAGYHVPNAVAEDMAALQVASRILSNGESSRIYRKMVYEDKLALYAGGSADESKDPSLFYAYCGMNIGKDVAEGEKELFDIIEGLTKNPPTDEELQKAKNQMEAEYIFNMQTNWNKGYNLGWYQTVTGDWHGMLKQVDRYQAVTAEKVAEVAAKYFTPNNRTTIILVPDDNTEL
ncbi:MAG: pitrilysin family protein [bacterium]|nr:pitrilysin family protein [bacterium]